MSGKDYVFEDWQMAKDRIKHFDGLVVSIRLQGIGIAAAIMSIGVASLKFAGAIQFYVGPFALTGPAVVVLLGSLYLIPVAALDWFHYKLMLLSVQRALEIENDPAYKGKLRITTVLTSPWLTRIHNTILVAVYVGLMVFGLVLAYVLNSIPPSALLG